MALLAEDCPRCGAKHVTFDVVGQTTRGIVSADWVERFEVFCVCRRCHRSTVFVVDNKLFEMRMNWQDSRQGIVKYSGYLNDCFTLRDYVTLKDKDARAAPEHTPGNIAAVFLEASTCVSAHCWNAAGAMFRLVIDLATKQLLPPMDQDPPAKVRRSLGLRLDWLFANASLPPELQTLANCVKEDGNDGAHDGTLTEDVALDLMDFTENLLERLYTLPKRIELAAERRKTRREM